MGLRCVRLVRRDLKCDFGWELIGLRPDEEHAHAIEEMEGEAKEKLLFKGVRDLFEAMANSRPLMLVFEDLHWADESSLRLLETLLRLSTTTPTMIASLARPEQTPVAMASSPRYR